MADNYVHVELMEIITNRGITALSIEMVGASDQSYKSITILLGPKRSYVIPWVLIHVNQAW